MEQTINMPANTPNEHSKSKYRLTWVAGLMIALLIPVILVVFFAALFLLSGADPLDGFEDAEGAAKQLVQMNTPLQNIILSVSAFGWLLSPLPSLVFGIYFFVSRKNLPILKRAAPFMASLVPLAALFALIA